MLEDAPCPNPACIEGFVEVQPAEKGQAAVVAPCPKCRARRRVKHLAELYARAGLAEILKGYKLPGDKNPLLTPVETTEPGWDEIEEHAERLPEIIELGINFLFLGPRGTGKSQAGALMIAKANKLGFTASAVSVPDWLMLVQNDYSADDGLSEFAHIERLCSVDFLMLDELGADLTKDTTTAGRLLSRVLTKRYDLMKPTLITTNLQARADANAVQDLVGGRAYDRFAENAVKLQFIGKNYRAEVQRQRLNSYLTRRQAAD